MPYGCTGHSKQKKLKSVLSSCEDTHAYWSAIKCGLWKPLLWNQLTCTYATWEWDMSPTTAFLEPVQNGNRLNRNQTEDQDVIPVCILFNNLPQRQVCDNTNSCYHGIVSCCMWWKKWSKQNYAGRCLTATSTAYEATVSAERKREMLPAKQPVRCNSTQAVYYC